ncbi:MAG TPA: ATP synthase F0 subunit B [Terriglobales bacterium]|nr:ATP synthase F0 subunit B [Terriglobales bacterium]
MLVLIALFAGTAWSQQHSSQSAQPEQPQKSEQKKPAHAEEGASAGRDEGLGAELAEESREAAGEDETAEFKHSATVRWLAHATGLTPFAAYWVFVVLNFVIIAVLLVLMMKSKVPAAFRARTESIQEGIAEARKASEEAQRRLSDIESRLAKLDTEIAAMAAAAEAEARKEEARIHTAAEEDKRKIVQAAEQEIVAATRLARTELRAYVSELAVALAGKRIQVNVSTDQELVRAFVDQLGKNGK